MFEFRYNLSIDDLMAFMNSRVKNNRLFFIFQLIAVFLLAFINFCKGTGRFWVFAIFYALIFFLPLLYRWLYWKSFTNSPFIGEIQITFEEDKIIKKLAGMTIEKTYAEIVALEERSGNLYIISRHKVYSDIIPVALLKKMGKRQALLDFLEKKCPNDLSVKTS